HRGRALLLAGHQERIEQAASQRLLQTRGVVVAGPQARLRFTRGPRQAHAVVPVADLAIEPDQRTIRLGVGLHFAGTAGHAAPAVGDGCAVSQLARTEVIGHRTVDRVIGAARVVVERIPGARIEGRSRRGAGGYLVGFEDAV